MAKTHDVFIYVGTYSSVAAAMVWLTAGCIKRPFTYGTKRRPR